MPCSHYVQQEDLLQLGSPSGQATSSEEVTKPGSGADQASGDMWYHYNSLTGFARSARGKTSPNSRDHQGRRAEYYYLTDGSATQGSEPEDELNEFEAGGW